MTELILVTGGAGFIGSNLCERLVESGKEVICIDNFDDFYDPLVKERNLANLKGRKNFILYKADIRDYKKLREIFEKHCISNKISKIVHLAARAGVRPSISSPQLYANINIIGTLNLLELAKEFKIRNFVFASSSSVYGANKKIPFSENDPTESQISPYGATKKACETYCFVYHTLYNLNITCLRFFTVYGPRGRPDMAPYKFTKLISDEKEIQVYGDGSSKRDYTYVSDIIDGIVLALEKNLLFEIINLGCGNPIVLKDFIALIEKNLGKNAIIRYVSMQEGDMDATYSDISKAKALLGYGPKVCTEKGIRLFIEWFKKTH